MPSSKDFDITALLMQYHQLDNKELLKLFAESSEKYTRLAESYNKVNKDTVLNDIQANTREKEAVLEVLNWRAPFLLDHIEQSEIAKKQKAIDVALEAISHAQKASSFADEKIILAFKKSYLLNQLAILDAQTIGPDQSTQQAAASLPKIGKKAAAKAQALTFQKKQTLYEAWCYEVPIDKLAEEKSRYLEQVADAQESNGSKPEISVAKINLEILGSVIKWRKQFVPLENSQSSCIAALSKIKEADKELTAQLKNARLSGRTAIEFRRLTNQKQCLSKTAHDISAKLVNLEQDIADQEKLAQAKAGKLADTRKAEDLHLQQEQQHLREKKHYEQNNFDWNQRSRRAAADLPAAEEALNRRKMALSNKLANSGLKAKENLPNGAAKQSSDFDHMLSSMMASTGRKNSRHSIPGSEAIPRASDDLASPRLSRNSKSAVRELSPESRGIPVEPSQQSSTSRSHVSGRGISTTLSRSNTGTGRSLLKSRTASISSQSSQKPAASIGPKSYGQYLSFMTPQSEDAKLSKKERAAWVAQEQAREQELLRYTIKFAAIRQYLTHFKANNKKNSKGSMLAEKILVEMKALEQKYINTKDVTGDHSRKLDLSLVEARMDKKRHFIKKFFDKLRRWLKMPSSNSSLELKKGLDIVLSNLENEERAQQKAIKHSKPRK